MKKEKRMKVKSSKSTKNKTVETETAPIVETKNWTVNCPKCGVALNLKEDGTVYICPVCSSVLRVKSGSRLVKDVTKEDKTMRVNVTEKAIRYLLEKEAERAKLEKKRCARKRKKARKAAQSLESKLAVNALSGYTKEDCFIVDLDENANLSVKKA